MKVRFLPTLTYGLATVLLILAVVIFRIIYLCVWCPLDLSPDEAHYWDWSRNLDWSYYSKGPLVAVLIRLGCWLFGDLSVALTGTQMAALRMPAIICSSLLLWGLYRLTVEVYQKPLWGFAVVGIALTTPLISAGAYLMTIDAPYTAAWVWALVWSYRALFAPEKEGYKEWVFAGLCVCLGVLAKHTMVLFVPMLGLFLLMARYYPGDASTRRSSLTLFQPGFFLMAAIGALGGLPILLWNIQNGWVTLEHTRGHAGLGAGRSIHWFGPLNYLGLQAALLLGYWFVVWVGAVWRYRPGKETDSRMGFLWWMSVPMFMFFALFSFKNGGGEPNWPVAAYLSGIVLAVPWLASYLNSERLGLRTASRAGFIAICGVGMLLSLVVHDSRLLYPMLSRFSSVPDESNPTPMRRLDPSCRLKGWQTLAQEVEKIREELRGEGIEPVLAGGSWTHPGEVGFYCSEQPVVYCLGSALGDRHSQYDLWRPNPIADGERFLGKTFILIGLSDHLARDKFEQVDPTRRVVHRVGEHPLAVWDVTVGRGLRKGWQKGTERY